MKCNNNPRPLDNTAIQLELIIKLGHLYIVSELLGRRNFLETRGQGLPRPYKFNLICLIHVQSIEEKRDVLFSSRMASNVTPMCNSCS